MYNTIRYKPEVEPVLQTGSTNRLATDIDAISMAIPILGREYFTGVQCESKNPPTGF